MCCRDQNKNQIMYSLLMIFRVDFCLYFASPLQSSIAFPEQLLVISWDCNIKSYKNCALISATDQTLFIAHWIFSWNCFPLLTNMGHLWRETQCCMPYVTVPGFIRNGWQDVVCQENQAKMKLWCA